MGSGCFRWSNSPRVDVYDPATDAWSLGPELSKTKYFLGAGVIGSTIYLAVVLTTSAQPEGATLTLTVNGVRSRGKPRRSQHQQGVRNLRSGARQGVA